MNLLLILLAAALLLLAWLYRPPSKHRPTSKHRPLNKHHPPSRGRATRSRFRWRDHLRGLAERMGTMAGTMPSSTPASKPGKTTGSIKTAKRLWATLLASVAVAIAFAGSPALLLVLGGCGVAWHWKRRSNQRQSQNIIGDLAEVIDLFLLGTSAGLTVWLTLEEVSKHAQGQLGETLRDAVHRVNLGTSLTETLDWLSHQHNGQLRLLTRPLIEAERYGVALEPSLLRAREEARQLRRRQAEVAARRVPVKLMFPLVLCILPAFGLLTVVPQLVSTLNLLRTPT